MKILPANSVPRSEAGALLGEDIGRATAGERHRNSSGLPRYLSLTRDVHLPEVGCGAGGPSDVPCQRLLGSAMDWHRHQRGLRLPQPAKRRRAAAWVIARRSSAPTAGGRFPFANRSFRCRANDGRDQSYPRSGRSSLGEPYRRHSIEMAPCRRRNRSSLSTGAVSSEEIATRSSIRSSSRSRPQERTSGRRAKAALR